MTVKEIWSNYFKSFTGKEEGFLRRKLMAFAGVWTAAVLSWKYTDASNIVYIVAAWLLFALLCAGLVTFEQVVKLKNGTPQPTEPSAQEQRLPESGC